MKTTQDPSTASIAVSDEALRWIVKLHSGAATADDMDAFQAWRRSSEENELAAREAEGLWTDVDRLYGASAADSRRHRDRVDRRARRTVLFGAAVLVGGAVGLGVRSGLGTRGADYATGTGETRVVDLPDGSRVTLNACSGVDLKLSTRERRVSLVEGQAFFEVAPDRVRPFTVEAGPVAVTALGTAFDVDRYLVDGAVAVAVTQHAVEIEAVGAPLTRGKTRLQEGYMIVADRNGHLGPARFRPASVTDAWRRSTYVAEDTPLGDVVRVLGSYHPGWIVLRGAGTAAIRVNAVLALKAPDRSLDALAEGLPITVFRLSPYLVVVSSR